MAEKLVHELTGSEIVDLLSQGKTSVSELYEKLLKFVTEADKEIKAFCHIDDKVLELHARHLDDSRKFGEALGPLFGLPVGVKDIIDTIDLRTEFGSPIYAGRYAAGDATIIRRLRAAGAVVFGKTKTTEFATMKPTDTRNPHNLEHTPGGSSAGSAAAVAAGMVPVAIGTQTNGSVLRPASFCGVYGFKPTRGLVPRTGTFEQSPSLDQIGVFARTVEDIAMVCEVIGGDDGFDESTKAVPPLRFMQTCVSEPPITPKFVFVKTPWWDQVEPEAQEAYMSLVEHLSDCVEVHALPDIVTKTIDWHFKVNHAELAFAMQRELATGADQLSEGIKAQIEAGAKISVVDYLVAKERIPHTTFAFDEYFDRYDAILCPAALGGAPKGLETTGNPIMQTVWSFAGLPAISLPMLRLSNGLPLGVQAVGAYKNDARLLRSVRWLMQKFQAEEA
jgi:Asp-tRNA(Asn)/Glu-tRNA(Gln) amidotransferase A subunit family amidase